jgi:hypothetical protein
MTGAGNMTNELEALRKDAAAWREGRLRREASRDPNAGPALASAAGRSGISDTDQRALDDAVQSLVEDAGRFMKDHPLMSVVFAFVAAIGIGRLLGR